VTVEQAAQAAQDAAAAGLAARIAAARFAATALFTTAARLSGATAGRFLSGAAGLFGTTAARFATASFFTAARLAAAIMLVEQVEQAATMTAAVVATTTTMAEEGRSAVGARKHRGDAQDQRHQTKTNVHRGDSYTKLKREGNTRLNAPPCEPPSHRPQHVASAAGPKLDVGSPHSRPADA